MTAFRAAVEALSSTTMWQLLQRRDSNCSNSDSRSKQSSSVVLDTNISREVLSFDSSYTIGNVISLNTVY